MSEFLSACSAMGRWWIEHFPAVAAAITSIGTLFIAIYNTFIIRTVRHQSNAMKDELVDTVRNEARRIGVLEGRRQMGNYDDPTDTT
jgi:hypothetical protein